MKVDWDEIYSNVVVGIWATIEYTAGCLLILLALWYFFVRPIFQ